MFTRAFCATVTYSSGSAASVESGPEKIHYIPTRTRQSDVEHGEEDRELLNCNDTTGRHSARLNARRPLTDFRLRTRILQIRDRWQAVMLEADVAALMDITTFNAGFIVIRPTWYSKYLYEQMQRIAMVTSHVDDQEALNHAVRRLRRMLGRYKEQRRPGFSSDAGQFKAVALDTERFVCGLDFFELADSWYPANNSSSLSSLASFGQAIVVHNNWIVSREAKIYRFKEHLMWMNDRGNYYSSNVRKYLVYDNPLRTSWLTNNTDDGNDSIIDDVVFTDQMNALQSALVLGRLLGRVVILPRFHCNSDSPRTKSLSTAYNLERSHYRGRGPMSRARRKKRYDDSVTSVGEAQRSPAFFECPLNALLHVTTFDAVFDGSYRENSFLQHPKVPEVVKTDITSRRYDVVEATAISSTQLHNGSYNNLLPLSSSSSSSLALPVVVVADEVRARLGDVAEKVLTLGQLYDVRPRFSSLVEQLEFDKSASRAFKRSNYRQL